MSESGLCEHFREMQPSIRNRLMTSGVFSWESQAGQYPAIGSPGIRYYRGSFPGKMKFYVDCWLYRDESGELVGILNHYPIPSRYQKKGDVNIWVRPDKKRCGIATALLKHALKTYDDIDLRRQDYSNEGLMFIKSFVEREKL